MSFRWHSVLLIGTFPDWARIYGWPATVGLRTLDALIAERPAQPIFRQWMNIRGRCKSIAFRKNLRLSGWRMAYPSFIVFRATSRWNYRVCRQPQLAASFVKGRRGTEAPHDVGPLLNIRPLPSSSHARFTVPRPPRVHGSSTRFQTRR